MKKRQPFSDEIAEDFSFAYGKFKIEYFIERELKHIQVSY